MYELDSNKFAGQIQLKDVHQNPEQLFFLGGGFIFFNWGVDTWSTSVLPSGGRPALKQVPKGGPFLQEQKVIKWSPIWYFEKTVCALPWKYQESSSWVGISLPASWVP